MVYEIARRTINTPIKINLALHVRGLLENNYHSLESLVVFSPCGDEIHISMAATDTFTVSGRFADKLSADTSNIIIKTRNKLQRIATDLGINYCPIHIKLNKRLPIASGLGGGSGDAAAAIISINDIWGLKLTEEKLFSIANELGADVPACLHYLLYNKAIYISGTGNHITTIDKLPSFYIILINDLSQVSSEKIFSQLKNKNNPALEKISQFSNLNDLLSYLATTRNDLYKTALAVNPNIAHLSNLMSSNGALFTTMSGSGSTIIGIFDNIKTAYIAAMSIHKLQQDWFIKIVRCSA